MPAGASDNAALFNRAHVRRQRDRAAPRASEHFLKNWVIDNLSDRLQDVKRDFETGLVIGAPSKDTGDIAKHLITTDISSSQLRAVSGDRVHCAEDFLPFKSNSFDLVYSPLCLHSVNDLPGALIQINRCLRPDGLFIGAMFGGETLFELRSCITEAELNMTGGISPRVFPFADKQQAGALLQRAGFALPVVDSELLTVTYTDMNALMSDLRLMGETNVIAARDKKFTSRRLFELASNLYSKRYAEEDGRIVASFEIIFMIGWAPHESQQQPLRPGSAENRLSEFLNTEEIKI